jgi:sulfide:quinone oxidoreductase
MRELPGDVFVTGQLLPAQIQALAEQGVMSFINNRPDMEAPMQIASEELEKAAQKIGVDYHHIPMSGGISPGLIDASVTAFSQMPRPIVAFCASGMRSAALWGFAHVREMGVEAVMDAIAGIGFEMEQLRVPLTQYADASAA